MLKSMLLHLSGSDTAKKVLTGTPLTRSMSQRFVPGETVEDLVAAIREANDQGMTATANYLGESVHEAPAAERAARMYRDLTRALSEQGLDAGLSLKFTQLGQDIGEETLRANLEPLLADTGEAGLFLRFDMESSAYTQQTLDAFEGLWSRGVRNIGVVLQAYLHRTERDVAWANRLGAPVRLCKGAYAEGSDVAFQGRSEVDRAFVDQMQALLSEGHSPAIATHDEKMISATIDYAERESLGKERFEFQMLFGVRRDLQRSLVEQGYRMRVYIPFGESWYPYLMRRLAERPGNVLFLAGSVFKESPLGSLGRRRT